ncbi:MAG: hypothetical protein UZ08_BCD001000799 [Candidatus Parvibacillus calidus]|jgi:hypothetical protein|nr:MAG: hypothetical protein UZ08_BCD001000799 [Candidatus Parvibacillus calidus]
MNKKDFFNKIFAVLLLAVVVFGSTSCNRGYGCPYNTSAGAGISKILNFNLFK